MYLLAGKYSHCSHRSLPCWIDIAKATWTVAIAHAINRIAKEELAILKLKCRSLRVMKSRTNVHFYNLLRGGCFVACYVCYVRSRYNYVFNS